MDLEASPSARTAARTLWNQARRKAFWQRMSYALGLTKRPVSLLSFEEVQAKLRLHQNAYQGLQEIPLDKIVGSVGRYHDFTRTFLPLVESDGARWMRVAELQSEAGLPPIEVYQVGDVYFVKDGNHRVSVARQLGAKTIEAYVWRYESAVGGVSPEMPVDDLIVKAEYRAFLDRTRLDIRRPEAKIILTEPGTYPALELEIELYRQNLERIDGEDRTYEEAAVTWYDLVYSLAVDVIAESGVLDLFPGRTEADLYVWVSQHRRELAERYGESVSLREAVQLFAEKQQRKPSPVGRVVRSVVDFVNSLTASSETVDLPKPEQAEVLRSLLVRLEGCVPSMAYRGERGEEWRAWRSALRSKVWDLIGLDYQRADEVPFEVIDTALISGVERTKIRMQAADGLLIPAYVMKPVDLAGPLPALLVYPGHGTIKQTAGLEYSPHRSNALALAQAGYVTLTIEARGIGELGQVDHTALDSIARLIGYSWLAMVLGDGLRALDFLQARTDVDPSRIGVTGFGLGGGLALYTAALDERVRAVVIENFLGGGIDPLEVLGHGCDYVPQLWRYAEIGDVARLIVPRPALYAYPADRPGTEAARKFFNRMRPSYEMFRCPDRTYLVEPGASLRYYRTVARDWFDRWLVEEEDTGVLLWAPREE